MTDESDTPDPKQTDGEETTGESNGEQNDDSRREKPNKLTLEAGSLTVKAESVDESVSDLAETCSDEMESLMQYHLKGELEILEEQNLHGRLLGDD